MFDVVNYQLLYEIGLEDPIGGAKKQLLITNT
jgi:hypothetical protein